MNRGGLEVMLMNYYRTIDRTKIQFDFMMHRPERGAFDDEIESLGGKIYRMPAIHPKTFFKYCSLLDSFFSDHPEYRVVHSHINDNSGFVVRAAKKHGVPCRIAHSHIADFGIDYKFPFRLFARYQLSRNINQYFVCSPNAGQWLFGKNIEKKQTLHVLKNAIQVKAFAPSAETRARVRQELGISDALVIGHVGRFNPQKNHRFLIDIFSALQKKNSTAQLFLIGDGDLQKQIQDQVSGLALTESVRFLGSRNDIPDLLQAIDVFVFPSLYEGLPVTVIEAQAAGLPCVLSDSITRECDVTGNVRFLPLAAGAETWAEEILKLQGTGRLPDAAQKVAAAGYDVQQTAKWLEEFYLREHRGVSGE